MTDKEKLQVMTLRLQGNGYGAIASRTGISVNTIKSYCKRNNLNGDMPVSDIKQKNKVAGYGECEYCGKRVEYILGHKKKRFCCDACRSKWWNEHSDRMKRNAMYTYKCPGCGKEFEVYGNSHRKYCCHECYIRDRFGGGSDE